MMSRYGNKCCRRPGSWASLLQVGGFGAASARDACQDGVRLRPELASLPTGTFCPDGAAPISGSIDSLDRPELAPTLFFS